MAEDNNFKKSALERYAHGGGIDAAAARAGLPAEQILDFSASINPHGPPEQVLAAARESLSRLAHYPEVDAATFESELADHHGLAPRQVLAGSGSTELIYLLPRALRPHRALLVAPCFSEYERALLQASIPFDYFTLSPQRGFAFRTDELLEVLRADSDMVWLANPGNPTGALIAPEQVEELAGILPEHVTLVVDEAFIDFAPEFSCTPLLGKFSNLVILRSMTKFYAIPGLRLGYLLGAPARVARLAQKRLPWSLSTPALAAGRACLGANDFRYRTLRSVPALRRQLSEGLAESDLLVFDSAANYLLVRLPQGGSAARVASKLGKRGILVRDCGNFEGLDGSFFRVAVRGADENSRLLQTLRQELRQ